MKSEIQKIREESLYNEKIYKHEYVEIKENYIYYYKDFYKVNKGKIFYIMKGEVTLTKEKLKFLNKLVEISVEERNNLEPRLYRQSIEDFCNRYNSLNV